MKLALAGFGLESVTFLPETTGVADFERGATRGEAVVAAVRGTNSVLGGFVSAAEREGVDLVGLVSVNAGAAAAASDEAYEKYTGEIVAGLRRYRSEIDGCLLHLHGALATPSVRRADAGVLAAIRDAMGSDFPVAVGMDLHGNLGPANLELATVVTGYHFSPHTDMARTGERAARLLIRALRGEIAPRMAIAKPGIILPSIFTATAIEPLAGLIRDARRMEAEDPALLDISISAASHTPTCPTAACRWWWWRTGIRPRPSGRRIRSRSGPGRCGSRCSSASSSTRSTAVSTTPSVSRATRTARSACSSTPTG
jgi:microcystin degradation protein MlrC